MGKGTRAFQKYSHVRKSIFSGVAVCSRCGYSLCSCGTVYKGEREKYWFLSCTHQRDDITNPCKGVRIRYSDLVELVRQDLNSLIALTDKEIADLVQEVVKREQEKEELQDKKRQIERASARLNTIDKMIVKLYNDNAEGKIADERMYQMVSDLEKEASGLSDLIRRLDVPYQSGETEAKYARFFSLAKQYTHIDALDRDTLIAFIDKIEVGPKIFPDGRHKATHRNQPFQQSVRIFYKFIGEPAVEPMRDFPQAVTI
jgi:hypothetical protein